MKSISFLIAFGFFASAALGHNTSVTRIDVKIAGAALTVTLNLNQADLLEHVLEAPHGQGRFADRTEFSDAAPKVLAYVTGHLPVSADGKELVATAPQWPPQFVELTHLDAGGLEVPSTIPLALRYALPMGARHMDINPRLFTAPNFAAVFDVTVYRDGLKPTNTLVDTHQPVSIDLTPSQSIGAEPPPGLGQTLEKFLLMGFHHIIPDGLDHILFVLGLYFLSPRLKDLLWQVTAFTIAHSITLGLAAFHIVHVPSHVIEPLIALSIVIVAVENLFIRRVRPWRWALVFCFGLIHGLGFADILEQTHLPTGRALTALFSFNVGVELGQLSVLVGAMGVTGWWQKRTWYFRYIAAPASIVIACIGAVWAVQRTFQG